MRRLVLGISAFSYSTLAYCTVFRAAEWWWAASSQQSAYNVIGNCCRHTCWWMAPVLVPTAQVIRVHIDHLTKYYGQTPEMWKKFLREKEAHGSSRQKIQGRKEKKKYRSAVSSQPLERRFCGSTESAKDFTSRLQVRKHRKCGQVTSKRSIDEYNNTCDDDKWVSSFLTAHQHN